MYTLRQLNKNPVCHTYIVGYAIIHFYQKLRNQSLTPLRTVPGGACPTVPTSTSRMLGVGVSMNHQTFVEENYLVILNFLLIEFEHITPIQFSRSIDNE